jgi:hypothetical protein
MAALAAVERPRDTRSRTDINPARQPCFLFEANKLFESDRNK